MLYKAVLVSAVQQCESASVTHVSPPSWAISPRHPRSTGPLNGLSSTPHNIRTSTCPAQDAVYTRHAALSIHPTLPFCPAVAHKSVLYVCISLPPLEIGSSFPRFHMHALMHNLFVSLLLIHFALYDTLGSSRSARQMTWFGSFHWLANTRWPRLPPSSLSTSCLE